MLRRTVLGLSFLLASSLCAQTPPPGGKSLFPGDATMALEITGQSEKGKMEKVSVTGQPFKEALNLTTLVTTQNPWDVQVHAEIPNPVQAGDTLLAEFWVRASDTKVESGEANSEFGMERVGEPWTKSISFNLAIGPQWTHYFVPFTAGETLDAKKSQVYFRMGYRPQAFQLAGFKLVSYGTKLKVGDLPTTKAGYSGMEDDASWRKEAQDRIEKIRKGDLTVTVVNKKGKPVVGAKISVNMKRHAFGFGTAVVASKLATSGDENDRYQKEVERLFNRVVFENDLKWGPWEEGASNTGYWRRQYVEGAMKWLSARHFDVRGHNMVWGTWRYIPASIKELAGDKAALEKAIEDRIADVGGAMKGQLVEWDVVNEPVPEHELTDILGKDHLVTWYKKARLADPKALLFVNDYPSPDTVGHLESYDQTIQYLLDQKAPLQGIGLQGHVGGSPWGIPALLATLDKLGAHGLPVEITEYDTDIKDEALDAQFLKDFLTAIFSHPSVNGFLMWGFWDGAHWHQKAPLFKQDWTPKLSEKVYEDLVFHDWWTNADGTTDKTGSYKVRGFNGDYEVKVTSGSKTVKVPAKLTKDGLDLPVTLK